jgi:hypothetical protein
MNSPIKEAKQMSTGQEILNSTSHVENMANADFLNFIYDNIHNELEKQLPNLGDYHISNNFLIKKKRIHIPAYSILFFLEVHVDNKSVLELITKTKKTGGINEYGKAVFNSTQTERARREYKLLDEVYNVYNGKTELRVPTPVLFMEEYNTLIFSKAQGTDLGKYLNQWEYSMRLSKGSQKKISKIISLVAHWLKYFHHHFPLEPMEISKEELVRKIIFDEEKISKWKYVPIEKVNYFKDQILKKGFPNKIKLPCANLHGDFKYRHIWNNEDKFVTVFDFGNQFEYNIIYEDLAGFLTETILMNYGVNSSSFNKLPKIIENIFLETYDSGIDKNLLNLFMIRYLFKKWFKRRRRIYRYLNKSSNNIKLVNPIIKKGVEKYTDYFFIKNIEEKLSLIS